MFVCHLPNLSAIWQLWLEAMYKKIPFDPKKY
jgi:hypothetical protein